MPTVTISLPESLREFVESQVRTRGYGNVSEYFRGLLRDAQEHESQKRLEKLLLEGLDSGKDIALAPRHWTKKKKAILARIRQDCNTHRPK
jgi:antitoxin ParD1/3/4